MLTWCHHSTTPGSLKLTSQLRISSPSLPAVRSLASRRPTLCTALDLGWPVGDFFSSRSWRGPISDKASYRLHSHYRLQQQGLLFPQCIDGTTPDTVVLQPFLCHPHRGLIVGQILKVYGVFWIKTTFQNLVVVWAKHPATKSTQTLVSMRVFLSVVSLFKDCANSPTDCANAWTPAWPSLSRSFSAARVSWDCLSCWMVSANSCVCCSMLQLLHSLSALGGRSARSPRLWLGGLRSKFQPLWWIWSWTLSNFRLASQATDLVCLGQFLICWVC